MPLIKVECNHPSPDNNIVVADNRPSDEAIRFAAVDLAAEIEAKAASHIIAFVNVSGMTKNKAKERINEFIDTLPFESIDSAVPFVGEGSDRLEVVPGRPTIQEILATAEKIVDFVYGEYECECLCDCEACLDDESLEDELEPEEAVEVAPDAEEHGNS